VLLDYHLHTDHSVDGHATMRQICRRAADLGFDEIAVTDHLDSNPSDPGAGRFNVERWFEDFQGVRDDVADRVTIRAGVEIGEPHEYRSVVADLGAWPFDLIIGSVHYIGTRGVHEALFDDLPLDEALDGYFDTARQIACCGLVDILGHLDCFQRYSLARGLPFDPHRYERQIRAVLEAVIRHDMALEVNTSGVRQQPGVCFPGRTILTWYHQMGGRAVTVGSDAHYVEHVGANITDAVALLRKIGFDGLCVFDRRQRRSIPLATPNP